MKDDLTYLLEQLIEESKSYPHEPLTAERLIVLIERAIEQRAKDEENMEKDLKGQGQH